MDVQKNKINLLILQADKRLYGTAITADQFQEGVCSIKAQTRPSASGSSSIAMQLIIMTG
ncbi:hypothetical protein ACRQ5D_33545 [Mucilaginibacter sp. P25]|uniref:hypothetical protein n=1 Tax=Mucilaginibacter sp. P25 TaxID=3423945 RepID=UPI003D7BB44A